MIEDTIEPSDPKFGDITDYSSSDESIVESSTNNHPKSNPFYRLSACGADLRQIRENQLNSLEKSNFLAKSIEIQKIIEQQAVLLQFYEMLKNEAHRQPLLKISLNEGQYFAMDRLEKTNFELSISQPETPADGSCFIHALIDQMSYDPLWKNVKFDILRLRAKVILSLDNLILKGKLVWADCDPTGELGSKEIWANNMKDSATFADHIFIYLAAEYLSREFIIIPVFPPQTGTDRVHIKPCHTTASYKPFYFLYYSDARFISPHYQSILPITENMSSDATIPVIQPVRNPISSVPDDICDISEPVYTSSGNKRKNTQVSTESTDVIESSQQSKKSRELSYMSETNIISSKRRRVTKKK